jgi:hypothetical protein
MNKKVKQLLCKEMFVTKGVWQGEDNFERNNVQQ